MARHYPDLGSDASSVWEFLRSFVRLHLVGKPVVVELNVGCFLRLMGNLHEKVSIKGTP